MIKKACLIFDWIKLPAHLKEQIAEHPNFQNGSFIKLSGEFSPNIASPKNTWAKTLTYESLMLYYEHQTTSSAYPITFEQFIQEYELDFELWLVQEKIDLTNVEIILIHVWW